MLPTPADFSIDTQNQALKHLDCLTKPPGSLGRLESLAAWWCGATASFPPQIPEKTRLYTFAADHGVTAEGVSPYPSAVTVQMVANFLGGGAASNVFARHHRVGLVVVDVGVASELPFESTEQAGFRNCKVRLGTGNMRREPAMSQQEAEQAVGVGIAMAKEASKSGVQLIGAGEMGIGNTTAAAAVLSAATGMPGKLTAGRGTGVDDAGLKRKIQVIDDALALHKPAREDGWAILRAVGGLELAAIAGLCIGGAHYRLPVVLDGFISTAGGLLASILQPECLPFLVIGHKSAENAHWAMSKYLKKEPIHELDLRLGEGTGAILAMDTVRLAARVLREMATFQSAGVSDRE
jgi:nicotinate-nucleotide--dimethylbenzimidazole phosphoribosyltransferase